MSGWNIRVVRHRCKAWARAAEVDEAGLELQEVYYGLNGKREPTEAEAAGDYHHGNVSLIGGNLEELQQTAERLAKAVFMTKTGFINLLDCKCDAMQEEAKNETA